MTPDSGYMKCRFSGSAAVLAAFRAIAAATDRQNQFSCGLSWLDDLDREDQVESEAISYDSISSTQEFLSLLLERLPQLEFEGTLEHSWPVLPCGRTVVEFRAAQGELIWEERTEEEPEPFDGFDLEFEEEDEIYIPLTPYD